MQYPKLPALYENLRFFSLLSKLLLFLQIISFNFIYWPYRDIMRNNINQQFTFICLHILLIKQHLIHL